MGVKDTQEDVGGTEEEGGEKGKNSAEESEKGKGASEKADNKDSTTQESPSEGDEGHKGRKRGREDDEAMKAMRTVCWREVVCRTVVRIGGIRWWVRVSCLKVLGFSATVCCLFL